jgi:ribonuclease D
MNALRGIRLHHHDLPASFEAGCCVALDTEAMGLRGGRDRLCLVQLSNGDGICHLIKIDPKPQPAPNLVRLLGDPSIEKLFHFARFDIGILYQTFGVLCSPVYCTKIASRLARTYTERHGLKELCKALLSIDISKTEQCSDWGAETLSDAQKSYAASDVLYLHALKQKLDAMLDRENRKALCEEALRMVPGRVLLDCSGFPEDIFSY